MSSVVAESSERYARPGPAAGTSPLRFLTLPRVVFAIFFLYLLFAMQLDDPDYYWHLATGDWIVAHRALPDGDPFSYTFDGKPWPLSAWLFELALSGVFALAGATGVKVATASLATAALLVSWRTVSRLLGGSTVSLLLAVVCMKLLSVWVVPRPHLVTYLMVALFVDRLVRFRYDADDRRLWLLPLLMVLWTNLHGAFVIGIALLGLFCACEWARHLYSRGARADRRRLLRLTAFTGLTILATAINPKGPQSWLMPAKLLEATADTPLPGEFWSPDFHTLYGKLYLAFAFGFFAVAIYRRHRPDVTELLFPMAALFIGFTATRHVPIAVLVVLPFVAIGLRDGPLQRFYGRRIAAGGRELGNAEYLLNAVLLVAVAAAFTVLIPQQQAKADAALRKALPVGAVDYVRSHGITGRMFNDYTQGGYLLYELAPQKVFVDGRGDIYGGAFINAFLKIRSGEPGWQKAFDAYAIDYVVVPRTAAIRDLLRARGDFKLVYDDATDSVLVRTLPRFDALPTLAVE
jgi:hypothetical protein